MSEPATIPTNELQTILPDVPHSSAADVRGRSPILDILSYSRVRRRRLIEKIETKTGRVLICYVSQDQLIIRDDVYRINQLIETIEVGKPITLLVNSPGGEVDPAEKMFHLIREASPPSDGDTVGLEVVVPDFAKSAATLIAIGADRIVMSDTSELGPIDPQIPISESQVSVFAFLQAYEAVENPCKQHPKNPAFARQLKAFSPVAVAALRQIESRARECAERLLLRQGLNNTAVAAILMDVKRFPSHGQMIDWRTARDIGLHQVHHEDRYSDLWKMYWHLYRECAIMCGSNRRVFESRRLFLTG